MELAQEDTAEQSKSPKTDSHNRYISDLTGMT